MHVKTFRGANTPATLARIKSELGDDAVILSNKTVTENGRRFCEIMAAVDPDRPVGRSGGKKGVPKRGGTAGIGTGRGAGADATKDEYLAEAMGAGQWSSEWSQIKGHIMALLRPQMNLEALSPRQRLALEYLEREGVETPALIGLFRRLSADPEQPLLPALESTAPVRPFDRTGWPQKFQAFCGPHGVGKTTTLLRLALREKKAAPKTRICLVAVENGRGKGRLLLRHYADLSGMAFREIVGPEDFALLLAESGSFDRIFVDLPALSGDERLTPLLHSYGMAAHHDLAVHLTLSPYFSARQLEAFGIRYECDRPGSIVWTKLDEACTFGALVNVAIGDRRPVSALSFGPGLKDSIVPATGRMLWRLIFKHQLPGVEAGETVAQGGA